jgi:hypothetical protein
VAPSGIELIETGVPLLGFVSVHGSFRNFAAEAAKNIKVPQGYLGALSTDFRSGADSAPPIIGRPVDARPVLSGNRSHFGPVGSGQPRAQISPGAPWKPPFPRPTPVRNDVFLGKRTGFRFVTQKTRRPPGERHPCGGPISDASEDAAALQINRPHECLGASAFAGRSSA